MHEGSNETLSAKSMIVRFAIMLAAACAVGFYNRETHWVRKLSLGNSKGLKSCLVGNKM